MFKNKELYTSFFLFIFILFIFFYQNSTISISDIDSINYIEGALSIKNGNGFKDLNYDYIVHWPSGYSYLLSIFFKDPIFAAYLINGLSLALCSVSIFNLLLKFEWDFFVSLSIVSFLTFGFLYSISIFAKPDIFAYTIFFFAVHLFASKSFLSQSSSLILLCFLILFKSIAVVFFPAFIIGRLINNNFNFSKKEFFSYFLLSLIYFIVILFVLRNNFEITGSLISETHPNPTIFNFILEIKRFVYDFFRMFLFNWYGSIKISNTFVLLFFSNIILSIFCFKDLKLKKNILIIVGLVMFLMMWSLQFVKIFHATPRLMAYSFIILLIGCNLNKIKIKRWSLLLLLSFGTLLFQETNVSHYGVNHPEYKKIVLKLKPYIPENYHIYSNGYKIFNIQNINSNVSTKWPVTAKNSCFVKITSKNFDAIVNVIYEFKDQDKNWFLIKKIDNAELYCNRKIT